MRQYKAKTKRLNYSLHDSSITIAERLVDLEHKADKQGQLEPEELLELERYLNPKQLAFAKSYIKTQNGRTACNEAGYGPTMTPANLLRDPKIKLMIQELMKLEKIVNSVSAQLLVGELKEMAFFDPMSCFEFDTMGRPMVKPDELKKAGKNVKKVKYNVKSGNLELEFYDRQQAIEMLAKHVGLYEKDNEQKKSDGVVIFLPDNQRTKDVEHIELPLQS